MAYCVTLAVLVSSLFLVFCIDVTQSAPLLNTDNARRTDDVEVMQHIGDPALTLRESDRSSNRMPNEVKVMHHIVDPIFTHFGPAGGSAIMLNRRAVEDLQTMTRDVEGGCLLNKEFQQNMAALIRAEMERIRSCSTHHGKPITSSNLNI